MWKSRCTTCPARNRSRRWLNAASTSASIASSATIRACSGKRSQASACLRQSRARTALRSEEHTSELQSLIRISYAVFCLKKKKIQTYNNHQNLTSQENQQKHQHKDEIPSMTNK